MAEEKKQASAFTKDFKRVFAFEQDYIKTRAAKIGISDDDKQKFQARIRDMRTSKSARKFKDGPVGLALSGGGIRSATFNLGLLQSLAKAQVLKFCDYLSTVSGGGYIGSCLTSLLDSDKAGVEPNNFPFRFDRKKESDERKEVKWLRRYGNYLALDKSLFRLDIWRIIGLYLSGFVLTNITTVAFLLLGTYALHFVPEISPQPIDLALALLKTAALIFVLMIIFRFVAALQELNHRARVIRGYIQGGFAAASGLVITLSLLIIGAHYLPKLQIGIYNYFQNSLQGLTIASSLGLLANLFKSENESVSKLQGRIFQVAWIILIPVLVLNLVHQLWVSEFLTATLFGIPQALIAGVFLLLIGLFINTNHISLHYFYRDRLSEAYVIKREDEQIISNEELRLTDLHRHDNGAPYHLINCTLNVPSSTDRYLRGRGLDYFLFSKFWIGSDVTGFCQTNHYEKSKMRLATALAISGAAASPKMGKNTSPMLTFFLTLLNIRLNRWLPNPNRQKVPWLKVWPYYFARELFGKGKETDGLLNLSDGGHLENTGIFQLLKRQCSVIIASDSGADPDLEYGDISNVMRKARIDLGIEINIDLNEMRYTDDSKFTKTHFAIGTISYPDKETGILVYIKSSMTDHESEDLRSFRRKNPNFPHESTKDQFFDEEQFESYRELGYRIGQDVFA